MRSLDSPSSLDPPIAPSPSLLFFALQRKSTGLPVCDASAFDRREISAGFIRGGQICGGGRKENLHIQCHSPTRGLLGIQEGLIHGTKLAAIRSERGTLLVPRLFPLFPLGLAHAHTVAGLPLARMRSAHRDRLSQPRRRFWNLVEELARTCPLCSFRKALTLCGVLCGGRVACQKKKCKKKERKSVHGC